MEPIITDKESLMRPCEIAIFHKIKLELSEIFDVGAYYDLDYYNIHPLAQYHLFDPITEFYNYIYELVKDVKNIKANNVACGDVEGKMKFYPWCGSIVLRTVGLTPQPNIFHEVDVIRLDNYIEQNDIKTFDFIKVDVEGYEYNVLKGLGKYLNEFKFIQIEYGQCWCDTVCEGKKIILKDAFELLNNYKAVKLETMEKYDKYSPEMEDFVCCNYLFYKPEYEHLI